jgi:hypothetical protein
MTLFVIAAAVLPVSLGAFDLARHLAARATEEKERRKYGPWGDLRYLWKLNSHPPREQGFASSTTSCLIRSTHEQGATLNDYITGGLPDWPYLDCWGRPAGPPTFLGFFAYARALDWLVLLLIVGKLLLHRKTS